MGGLGRRFYPDARDAEFPVTRKLATIDSAELTRSYRYWNASGWWGDQRSLPQCVGYSWVHWLEDGPVTQDGKGPILLPSFVYKEAQKVDEWPGENYDGTSVRAGAKVLQSKGFISEYHWARNAGEVVDTLLSLGPVVVGTNWYDDMFTPDGAGFISVGGRVAGGHAYKLDGVNVNREIFRIKNSWGRTWGNHGFAYISFRDMDRLINEDGEACLASEIRK